MTRNFLPGRTFRDLEDFNEQLRAWLTDVADIRIHGTTHERPIDRFAREAQALLQTREQPSFLQAMRRSSAHAKPTVLHSYARADQVAAAPAGIISSPSKGGSFRSDVQEAVAFEDGKTAATSVSRG